MGTEPYILSGFTDRFFTKRATGAEMMMFFSCSVLGTWTCAKLLDRYSQQGHQERGAHVAIAVFTAVHVLSFCCGGAVEFSQRPVPTGGWGLADFDIILPTVAFVLWGASDAMMNTYTYWVIGNMYPDGAQQAVPLGSPRCLTVEHMCWGMQSFQRAVPLAACSSCSTLLFLLLASQQLILSSQHLPDYLRLVRLVENIFSISLALA